MSNLLTPPFCLPTLAFAMGSTDLITWPEVAGQLDHGLMPEPTFANAGGTRVQLSDFTARRMFRSHFRTQTRTWSIAIDAGKIRGKLFDERPPR